MPDISMCTGDDCPIKEKCYRFTAIPSEYRQSYFLLPPYQKDTESCSMFWPNSNRVSIKLKELNDE